MDAIEAIRTRRSIRRFTGEPIPREDLETIIDAARLAATGHNNQPWEFVVVTDPGMLQNVAIRSWMDQSAAVVAVVIDQTAQFWQEDGSAAIQNMLIAVTALGYGACWVQGRTRAHEAELKQLLNVPDHLHLMSLVAVGVPDEAPEKEKKSLEQVLHWETYPTP